MLPIRELERHLSQAPPDLRDIVLQIRDLVFAAAPGVTEVIRRRDILYYYAQCGGPVSAGVCLVGLEANHVRLAFIHGAFLYDPAGLLRGQGLAKRSLLIDSFDAAPWKAIQGLIEASARFDPRTLSQNQALEADQGRFDAPADKSRRKAHET